MPGRLARRVREAGRALPTGPLDVLVLCQEPVVAADAGRARAIGLMTMIDGGKKDHKILAVAVDDPEFNSFRRPRSCRRTA